MGIPWIYQSIEKGILLPWEDFAVSTSLAIPTSSDLGLLDSHVTLEITSCGPPAPRALGRPSKQTRAQAEEFLLEAAKYCFEKDPSQSWIEFYRYCADKVRNNTKGTNGW